MPATRDDEVLLVLSGVRGRHVFVGLALLAVFVLYAAANIGAVATAVAALLCVLLALAVSRRYAERLTADAVQLALRTGRTTRTVALTDLDAAEMAPPAGFVGPITGGQTLVLHLTDRQVLRMAVARRGGLTLHDGSRTKTGTDVGEAARLLEALAFRARFADPPTPGAGATAPWWTTVGPAG